MEYGVATGWILPAFRNNSGNFPHNFLPRRLKSKPFRADKRPMDYSALSARRAEWNTERKRTAGQPNSNSVVWADWFTGLAVTPASFSRQLGDMQVAMQRETRMAPQAQAARAGRAR